MADRPRLSSWKEIAAFLNVSEKTARRWEMARGLPVHRVPGGAKASVFGYADELTRWLDGNSAWAETGSSTPHPEDTEVEAALGAASRKVTAWRRIALGGATVVVAGLALAAISRYAVGTSPRIMGGPPERHGFFGAANLPPLMSDGKTLYFQQSERGRFRIMQAPLSDLRKSVALAIPLENPDPGVVSPDGRSMLLRNLTGSPDGDEPLFVQPLPGGEPIRLGTIRAYDSAWTPDRRHIVFCQGAAVYLADPQGGNVRRLFGVSGRAHWFRWKPGSQLFRFNVYDSSRSSYRIWEAASIDSAPHPLDLGIDSPQQCCGDWSESGRYFFFQVLVGDFFQVFARREFGWGLPWASRAAVQLTTGPLNYRSPLPTRAGRLVALGQVQMSEVLRYDLRAGKWSPILDGTPTATVAYSKDGKRIAFTKPRDHTLWWCAPPQCDDPVQLTFPPVQATMPEWSPDGTRIACMTRAAGKLWQATVVSAADRSLTSFGDPGAVQADPTWSASGSEVAFWMSERGDPKAPAPIRIVNLRTRQLTAIPSSTGFVNPRWSPSGKFLAAVRQSSRELAFFDFAARTWRVLSGTKAGYLNWNNTGQRLYYLSLVDALHPEIRSVDIRTWKGIRVVGLSDVRRPAFSFGGWIGLGPDESPLALRDISTDEILVWPLKAS